MNGTEFLRRFCYLLCGLGAWAFGYGVLQALRADTLSSILDNLLVSSGLSAFCLVPAWLLFGLLKPKNTP